MDFLNLTVEQSIASTALPEHVDIVTALHACNTATDDAIRFGLAKRRTVTWCWCPVAKPRWRPCCARTRTASFGKTPLAEIWRHPIHTREFGSQLTNVLRCLQLEAHGYQVTVTELVGWEHSLKNELIIATHRGQPRGNAGERIEQILDELNLGELKQPLPALNEAGCPLRCGGPCGRIPF